MGDMDYILVIHSVKSDYINQTYLIAQVVRIMEDEDPPILCMTLHPGVDPVCLNRYSQQNTLNIYQRDYGNLQVRGNE